MKGWDLGELARAAGAELRGGALPVSVEAVGTDSRSLPPNCLFVALRGERFDGHAYAAAAAKAGARAVMVDAAGESGLGKLTVPRLVVSDTLKALGALAQWARRRIAKPVAAVTGSNGKTTTKELAAAALSRRGRVHKNLGNLNNQIGVPLTLLAWPDDAWAAVVEMGMNAPGEIAALATMAEPNAGVITNVGSAHLAGLGSLANIGRAKGELFAHLPATATAVVNADDPVIAAVCAPLAGKRRTIRFGRAAHSEVRLVNSQSRAGRTRVELSIGGKNVEFELPLLGGHNAMNAAAAAGLAWALGIAPEDIAAGMQAVEPPHGRLEVVSNAGRGIELIDDTYNANPDSMRAAFAALAELAGASGKPARRVAVLGDMLELGDDASRLHHDVGRAAGEAGVAWVLTLGEFASELAASAKAAGAAADAFTSLDDLLAALDDGLHAGDWVLVKGSRGMRMERVVEHLRGGVGAGAH